MQPFLQRPNRLGGRNLGTLRSSGIARNPYGFTSKPTLDQDAGPDDTLNTYTPRPAAPAPTAGVPGSPTPVSLTRPQGDMLSQIGATGVAGGRPVGSTGGLVPMQAGDEAAFQTAFSPAAPPQQTERANPLSGATSTALPGTSTVVSRPPFVSRPGGMPRGQDVAAPVKETMSEDEDIGRSMQGTYGRLADVMGRRFSQPGPSPASVLARAQLY